MTNISKNDTKTNRMDGDFLDQCKEFDTKFEDDLAKIDMFEDNMSRYLRVVPLRRRAARI